MRIFCILLFLVGLATGVIWPWAQRHFGGEEIGTWVLYQREGGYQSAKVQLKPEDAPLRIFVDAQPMQGVTSGQKQSVLNLAVSRDGCRYWRSASATARKAVMNSVICRKAVR
ncbi:hypothetical protein KHQ08_06700 [Pseudochrobactrum algeriensis]|uniref:hypothetical protein n=1 Tax=Pseudochrobactrum algeriensis TaxID=2834768 RepID=UPI001BCE99D6|nr:hypothetical protein [Pseudochrobactrum algeriensis]QVQ37711.1 hypothetical protein KHQ08_06700 [Pseudochrobactrum algeriensis]QVQ40931.1 hypothetical protein KHQ07_05000 [Pseudochrobactrum algeriensis]QVQ44855.1 hypothetical protein KHQ09_06965 [Pseudochrobactrum algeriensis]